MKGNKKEKRVLLLSCYFFMAITVLIAVTLPGIFADQSNYIDRSDQAIDAYSGWTYEDGSEADLCEFYKTGKEKITIYHDIPQTLSDGTSLCFSSRNIYTSVYVNGELAEETEELLGRDYQGIDLQKKLKK